MFWPLSTPPTPPLLLVTTNLISFLRVWCSEFWGCFTDSTCKWNHAVFVLVWLILFSIMSLRFIHVVTNCRIFSFYGWIIFHCMYKSQFYPFIHQQTGCCLILAILNKTSMNTGVQIFFWVGIFIVLNFLRIEIAVSYDTILIYLGFSILFSKVAMPICNLTAVPRVPFSLHPPNICSVLSFW